MDILQELNGMADNGYAVFHSKIANTKKRILGVRMPLLRALSKKIKNGENYGYFKRT